ncbi:MAG: PDZ domain-containing protein [Planctomycetes bacterium]|nr:PDZ domain-containing protein [Planctomycetota bacterium]
MNPLSLPLVSLFLLAPIVDGWLGVYLDPEREQAVVAEVIPESPAARAGLQAGDELLAVGDQATPTRDDLVAAIRAHKAGERLRIKLRRDGKESTVTVQLAERPDNVPVPTPGAAPVPPKQDRPPRPAVETAPVTPVPAGERKAYLGLRVRETDRGVVVDEAIDGGPAQALGIRPGERITALGDRPVRGLADLDAVLQRSEAGKKLSIGLQSDAGARSLTITLGAVPSAASGRAVPAPAQAPRTDARPAPVDGYDVEREIDALRRDLRELRQQLEELRRQLPAPGGRE